MIHPKIVENMTNQQNHLSNNSIYTFFLKHFFILIRYKDRLEHEHEHEHEHEAEPY